MNKKIIMKSTGCIIYNKHYSIQYKNKNFQFWFHADFNLESYIRLLHGGV